MARALDSCAAKVRVSGQLLAEVLACKVMHQLVDQALVLDGRAHGWSGRGERPPPNAQHIGDRRGPVGGLRWLEEHDSKRQQERERERDYEFSAELTMIDHVMQTMLAIPPVNVYHINGVYYLCGNCRALVWIMASPSPRKDL